MPIYNGRLPQVDEVETRRYAGLKHAEEFPQAYIKEACLEVQLQAMPQGIFEAYEYDATNGIVKSEPPLQIKGSTILKHLEKSERVYVMAVTIGEGVELRSAELFKEGNYTLGLLVDAAATTAVEQVADQVNAIIDKEAARLGYTTTWRFSPGYGNWDLTIQKELAHSIGTSRIGLSVTDSFLLFPRKSVTAIIGCMPKGETVQTKRGCSSCSQAHCASRRM
ncbi:methionine synthase [uncultured Veillonella sp.]|uniref:methionine synthase n=1 Tax=uncultured Veillonella sp. TaxID=159268 RepID=UPI0026177ECF|nr:methionine synthase [uncultured Veillonella sp.]